LVDTGLGNKWSEKGRDTYNIEHDRANLRGSILEAGYNPANVTDVILTHLHFDHAGGLTRHNQQGEVIATFAGARHHIQRANWAWAQAPSVRDAGSYHPENITLFGEERGPKLVLHEGEGEIVEGIEVLVCTGHTPGMQLPMVRLQGQTVLFMADLMPTRAHVNLSYGMGYDLFPLDNLKEKKAVLERAIQYDWILGLQHDPEVPFVRVERVKRGFKAVPCDLPNN
jgi:glyoxylase-like metal-dependent hydrolase (beta-lactamase superfamily II)